MYNIQNNKKNTLKNTKQEYNIDNNWIIVEILVDIIVIVNYC